MARTINLNSVLDLLRVAQVATLTEREMEVGAAFLSLWPSRGETLNSFRRTPNCGSCKHTLLEVLSEDPGRVKAFLKKIDPGQEYVVDVAASLPVGVARPINAHENKSMAGEVRDIEDTPEAYGKCIQDIRLRGWRYIGLTVRPLEPGRVRLYFY